MEKRVLYYNELPVSIKIGGSGIPVVFLHGYLESSEIWLPFVNDVMDTGKIILIDLPGHGETGVTDEIHTMDFMADVVKFVLDSLVLKKCLLIGHSMGGYVTLSFAKKYSDRLIAFILFHSHPFEDTEETRINRKREIDLVSKGRKEIIYNSNVPRAFATSNLHKFTYEINCAKSIAAKTPDSGIISSLKGMMMRKNHMDIINASPVPFIWILGRKDNYIDFETLMDKIEFVNRDVLIVLENSGHMGFIEEKERCLGIIIDFIRKNNMK